MRFSLLVLVMPVLVACQSLGVLQPGQYLSLYQDYPPGVKKFQVCQDVGCEKLISVSMPASHWAEISHMFKQSARSPREEREQVALAVARLEKLVGPLAGTLNDQPRNQGMMHKDAQLDCIAETVNTTTYLTLFEQRGWLKWHDVASPRHRGWLGLNAPHNTAVLAEKNSGKEYVIDTWFHANGEPPEIVLVEEWLAGYDPDQKKQN